MKAIRPLIATNRVSYLQMKAVGSHSKSGTENEGRAGVSHLYIVIIYCVASNFSSVALWVLLLL